MKRLIINADDFGLSSQVNKAIIEAFKQGVLTNASLLANGLSFQEAVALAKANPELGVGIHLNILRGKPLSVLNEVRSLVDQRGFFQESPLRLGSKILLSKISLSEIEKEFKAQIMKVMEEGVQPTHLDTEKHIHILPSILRIIIKLAKEFKINKIRCLKSSIQLKDFFSLRGIFFPLFRFFTALEQRDLISSNILMPQRIYGIFEAGTMLIDRYSKIFSSLPDGFSEIVCHPGYKDSDSDPALSEMGRFYLNRKREAELDTLLMPEFKSLVINSKIDLVSYKNLG